MRIAIDGRALTGRFTGDRTYWRNLLRALLQIDQENEYLVYSRAPIPPDELPDAPNVACRVLEASNDRAWSFLVLPRALKQDRADLAHVQYTVPLLCPCPIVTTVHDISFRLYPQWFPMKHRMLLNLTIPSSMQRAVRVITDSESSRKDMLRVYGLRSEKIVAIPLGLPEEFRPPTPNPSPQEQGEGSQTDTLAPLLPLPGRSYLAGEGDGGWESSQETARRIAKERFKLEQPFVLAVGVLQPRKNLGLLAEAFGKAKATYKLPHQLAVVGKIGWGTGQETLRNLAARHGGAEAAAALVFPGYVEDADLPLLYRACTAFAYPSLYEGFGLPPLEAMACGAPVLVSDAPALPEVAGDAALILPPTDVNAWAEGLARVLTDADLRRDLSERGPLRAALFTWKDTAARTLDIYREAVTPASAAQHG